MAGWRVPAVHAGLAPPREDRRGYAIGLMMLAFACFTLLDSSAKWLVLEGLSPWSAVFARYAVHLAIVAALVVPVMGRASLQSRRPWIEVARAALLLVSTLCNFNAVLYLPLTLTSTIFFTIPIFVCILSIPILGEKVGARRWAAIVVGFAGILIVTRPWTGEFHWAMLLSISAALFASGYQILTRLLAGVDTTHTQQLYAALVATIGVAPMAMLNWSLPGSELGWVIFAAMGVFGWIGHQVLTVAHRYAPASLLAPFIYVQLIYMTASSWLIFNTPPSRWVLLGAPVVIASGFYIWWRERQLKDAP